jgi:hypothetical protein
MVQLGEEVAVERFVSGHDFSRAATGPLDIGL